MSSATHRGGRFVIHESRQPENPLYIDTMPTLPFLPEGLPTWAIGLALAIGGLYLLVLLAMPFSVFGLKGRLDAIEARLDDIQADLHTLARRRGVTLEDYEDPPPVAAPPPVRRAEPPPPPRPAAPARSEPKLNWPR